MTLLHQDSPGAYASDMPHLTHGIGPPGVFSGLINLKCDKKQDNLSTTRYGQQ